MSYWSKKVRRNSAHDYILFLNSRPGVSFSARQLNYEVFGFDTPYRDKKYNDLLYRAIGKGLIKSRNVTGKRWRIEYYTLVYGVDPFADTTTKDDSYAKNEVDPYAELKAAHAAGKTIQYTTFNGGWRDLSIIYWTENASNYRIKPDKIKPEPAMQKEKKTTCNIDTVETANTDDIQLIINQIEGLVKELPAGTDVSISIPVTTTLKFNLFNAK